MIILKKNNNLQTKEMLRFERGIQPLQWPTASVPPLIKLWSCGYSVADFHHGLCRQGHFRLQKGSTRSRNGRKVDVSVVIFLLLCRSRPSVFKTHRLPPFVMRDLWITTPPPHTTTFFFIFYFQQSHWSGCDHRGLRPLPPPPTSWRIDRPTKTLITGRGALSARTASHLAAAAAARKRGWRKTPLFPGLQSVPDVSTVTASGVSTGRPMSIPERRLSWGGYRWVAKCSNLKAILFWWEKK